jgi:hypothetical protein
MMREYCPGASIATKIRGIQKGRSEELPKELIQRMKNEGK